MLRLRLDHGEKRRVLQVPQLRVDIWLFIALVLFQWRRATTRSPFVFLVRFDRGQT
jgi:hypothetical protein